MINTAPIGVFDSGVGGISILHNIHKLLPHENLIYIADSAHAPYGEKSRTFIQQRCLQLSRFLLTQDIKLLVVACNTATTEAIEYLREHLSIPVIGVEPAIKPAATRSKNKKIGVMATYRTIHSQRLQQLIEHHAPRAQIITQACPGLVELVEACKHHTITEHHLVEQYTHALLKHQVDTIVLGCTHYPFLLPHIRSIIGEDILVLDTGHPVSLQIQRTLQQKQLENSTDNTARILFYTSYEGRHHYDTIHKLWGKEDIILGLPSDYIG